jgi:hypothetical protein
MDAMGVAVIQSFLTHPGKDVDSDSQHRISATTIALTGYLFTMLNDIYEKAEQVCNVDIASSHAQNGINSTPCQGWPDVIEGGVLGDVEYGLLRTDWERQEADTRERKDRL